MEVLCGVEVLADPSCVLPFLVLFFVCFAFAARRTAARSRRRCVYFLNIVKQLSSVKFTTTTKILHRDQF